MIILTWGTTWEGLTKPTACIPWSRILMILDISACRDMFSGRGGPAGQVVPDGPEKPDFPTKLIS